ncbi:MAG: HEAT repeat domain-containing protein [Candidatus Hydrogenedentes bacterium]|nr:HEAT repeat domain-containing protein [Candidatus Hydrogenedentota bacterium]
MHLRLGLTILIAVAGYSYADTIVFPDGATMDGEVREVNANCFELVVGDKSIQFARTEIASIEKNDKRGDAAKPLVLPQVKQWEAEMERNTGLDADQREKFLLLVDAMRKATDPGERQKIESEILAMSKTVDLVKFIKASYDTSSLGRKMVLLAILNMLDPQTALPYLKDGMTVNNAHFRAFALGLYGHILRESNNLDNEAVTFMTRGLIDSDADVQLAAGNALAESGSKIATPVLLAKLDAADPRVQNAANRALAQIWSVDAASISGDPKAYWQEHWNANQSGVDSPLDPEKLEPLVDKDAPLEDAHH